jgi:hypothetical protein
MTHPTLLRPTARIVAATAAILAIPLLAMQFTTEVTWTLSDFVFAAAMLIGVGMAYVLITRSADDRASRIAVGFALAIAFFLVWSNLAVGIIGSESNPANVMYFGVLAVAVVGAAFARFQPGGMAIAMIVTAVAHSTVAAIAMLGGMGLPESGPAEIFVVNAFFVTLWLLAAAQFRHAALQRRSADGGERR